MSSLPLLRHGNALDRDGAGEGAHLEEHVRLGLVLQARGMGYYS